MTTLLDELRDNNCNVDNAIKRFCGKTDMYERFAKKFICDKSLLEYHKAFDLGDYKSAYRNVHNIKGISANLGFTDLYNIACVTIKALLEEKYDAAAQFDCILDEQHRKISAIIQKYVDEE